MHVDVNQLTLWYSEDINKFLKEIDKMDVGIGVYDSHSNPKLCNAAAYELLGLSKDQFLGKSAMDPYWKVVHEDGSKFEHSDFPIIEVITTYHDKMGVIMGVSRPLKNDKIWLEVDTYVIKNPDGSINYIICTYKDVSSQYLTSDL